MAEIGSILNQTQIANLASAGIHDKEELRAVSDEILNEIEGIGSATVKKLREWAERPEVKQGDAISLCYLSIREGDKRLNVSPGDVIPAEFDAETRVAQGKARWRLPNDI